MRACIVLSLILSFALGCSQPSVRAYRPPVGEAMREEPIRPAPEKSKIPDKPPVLKKPAKPMFQPLAAPLVKINKLLPTHLHAKDLSVMVLVPAGTYRVSTPASRSFSAPLQAVRLPAYYIDRIEITVAQYQIFQDEYDDTAFTGNSCPQCPAVGIDWHSAQRYCHWAGKKLPSEAEWEAAARGPNAQRLPWGDKHLPKAANILGADDGYDGLAPVGSFPLGASPFAALDMIGNAWEWVSPAVSSRREASGKTLRQAKGGSWRSPKQMAVISFRNAVDPAVQNPTFGFRCAKPASLVSNEWSGNQ